MSPKSTVSPQVGSCLTDPMHFNSLQGKHRLKQQQFAQEGLAVNLLDPPP